LVMAEPLTRASEHIASSSQRQDGNQQQEKMNMD
jgi:hypothetical protein